MAGKKQFEMIVDKLVELKDTSELMVDLAYSSLLLNNSHLAGEVQALEEHVDELHTEFEKLILSSGFRRDESRHFLGLIRLGVATEQIADAGNKIAEVVLRGLEPHPILKLAIEEAEETVVKVRISPSSPLIGKSLRAVQIPEETGMWVLAIRRNNVWVHPKPNTLIKEGDVLIVSGYADGEDDLVKLASPNEKLTRV